MKDWKSHIDLSPAYWQDYRHFLSRLDGKEFPDTRSLNRLLPGNLVNRKGAAVQFRPARQLADVPYEKHIYESAEISTRENNWHDLFNALVWCRLPRLKLAMNTLHARHMGPEDTASRGKVRDALTLFDECGAIVFSFDRNRIASLAYRDWKTAFEPESRRRPTAGRHCLKASCPAGKPPFCCSWPDPGWVSRATRDSFYLMVGLQGRKQGLTLRLSQCGT